MHAKGQVANFHIEEHFTEGKILSYLNHYLPDDIAVIAIEQVDELSLIHISLGKQYKIS